MEKNDWFWFVHNSISRFSCFYYKVYCYVKWCAYNYWWRLLLICLQWPWIVNFFSDKDEPAKKEAAPKGKDRRVSVAPPARAVSYYTLKLHIASDGILLVYRIPHSYLIFRQEHVQNETLKHCIDYLMIYRDSQRKMLYYLVKQWRRCRSKPKPTEKREGYL